MGEQEKEGGEKKLFKSDQQVPATLGTYFIVLTVFQTVVKAVAVILSILVRREIVAFVKDPRYRSTLTRQQGRKNKGLEGVEGGFVFCFWSHLLIAKEVYLFFRIFLPPHLLAKPCCLRRLL